MTEVKNNNNTASNSEEDKKLAPAQHYFWVDKKLLAVIPDFLEKRALLLYLLYTRSRNPKHSNCSFIGYTKARKALCLTKIAADSARNELIQKGLIKLRPDIHPGYFKTVPVEVLDFPEFDGKNFRPSGKPESIGWADDIILMPSILIDDGKLKELSYSELKTMLFLYSICRWEECTGVDFNYVYASNKNAPTGVVPSGRTFGNGWNSSITGKQCFEVTQHNKWVINPVVSSESNHSFPTSLNELITKQLFSLFPVVIWTDTEDTAIMEVRREVFPGLVSFQGEGEEYKKKYRLASLEEGEKIIWVLRPKFPPRNKDYGVFVAMLKKQKKNSFQIYKA